jgi:hypothetical protein
LSCKEVAGAKRRKRPDDLPPATQSPVRCGTPRSGTKDNMSESIHGKHHPF